MLTAPPAGALSATVGAADWPVTYQGSGLRPSSMSPGLVFWNANANSASGTFHVGTAAFSGFLFGYMSGSSPAENESGGTGTVSGFLSGVGVGTSVEATFTGTYTRSSSDFEARVVTDATIWTGSSPATGTLTLRVHGPWGTSKTTGPGGYIDSAAMTVAYEEADPVPNAAPGTPTRMAPADGTVIQPTDTQRFTVRATDPDANPYKARVTVTKNLDATTTTTTTTTFESAWSASGQDAHAVPTTSLPRGTYTWSAVAVDPWGATSGASSTGTFTVAPFVEPLPPEADGPTTIASVTTMRELADDGSEWPSVSADGRFVAFESEASNLVPGDTNGVHDVFVRDRGTGVTTRVSVTSSGGQSTWHSGSPSISADGRHVVFESYSPTLVSGDANGTGDVFLHDRATGTTSLVSVDSGGAQGNGLSQEPAISANGRYVAFRSGASNLVAGDTNGHDDVFVRDLQTGTTTRASIGNVGQQATYGSWEPVISANGQHVAFVSWAMNLINTETNFNRTVYLRDTVAGTTTRVAVAAGGGLPDGHSDLPVITPDGRWVGYTTAATNIVSSDTSINPDIVLYDRQTGANHLASVDGASNGSFGTWFSMSSDARYVAFVNGALDVLVRDRTLGLTRTVSQDSWGSDANGPSSSPVMSADGRWVLFESSASNLVHGDTNLVGDIFAYDTVPERDCIGEGSDPGVYTPVGCVTGYGAHATSSRLGLEEWMPYRTWELGTGTAYANMANGNLVVQHTDVDAPGQGLNLRLTRTYNLQGSGTDGPLGKGWRLGVADGDGLIEGLLSAVTSVDVGRVVRIVGTEDQFDFIDADGTKHHFIKGGLDGPGWHSPPGLNLTLSDHVDGLGRRYYRATRPDGVHYEFTPVALNYFLTKIADRKGNEITFTYTGGTSPVLSSITDTVGRSLVLTWSGNYVSNIRYNAHGTWLDTSYTVSGGKLTSVTEAVGTGAARTTSYGYDTSDRLTSVTDPRGNTTTFTLAASNQVTGVNDRASKQWTLLYNNALSCVPSVGIGANVTCLTDPQGNTSIWTTTAEGNLVHRRDEGDVAEGGAPRRNDKQWAWRGNRLVKEMDESGNVREYEYNANGQVTEVRDTGSGESTVVTRMAYQDVSPGVADLTSVRAAFGTADERVTTFANNANGTLASTTDAEGKTTTFTYYVRGLLKTVTDANGKTTTYGDTAVADGGYHSSGQPARITDATGQTKSFLYDFLGRNTQVTDRVGKVWSYEYDLRGNRTRETTPRGHATLHCYDANDNEVLTVRPKAVGAHCGMTEADPYVTRRVFDGRDLPTTVLTKSGVQLRKTAYTLADDGEVAEVFEPRSFDNSGNLLATVQKVVYERYPNNRIAAMVDEEGYRTDAAYTPNGLIRTVTKPPGSTGRRHTTTYTYNGRDQVTSQLELGHSQPTTNAYNAHGDKVSTKTPKGATTTFVYDRMGRVTRTVDGNGKLTRRVYDNVGNLVTLAAPKDTGFELVTNYTYTNRNEIDTETDPANAAHVIDYDYDGEGRQQFRFDKVSGSTQRTTEQTYYDDGRLFRRIASFTGTNTGRHVTEHDYDANGNTEAVRTTVDGAASPNVSSVTATYTTADEPLTWTETLWTVAGTGVTNTSRWNYLPDGVVNMRVNDSLTTNYSIRRNGWEQATMPWSGGSLLTVQSPDGSVSYQVIPGGTTVDQAYDDAGRLTSRIVKKSGGTVLAAWENIAWDDDDNRLAEQVRQLQTDNTTTLSGLGTYGYDPGGRMNQAKHPFEEDSTSYALDDAGNIVTETDFRYTYSDNRLTSRQALPTGPTWGYGHDPYGNQTSETTGTSTTTTTYDAASHTRRVTSPDGSWVEYAYDGADRMVRRRASTGTTTLFFHDGPSQNIAFEVEVNSAGAQVAKTRYVLDADGEAVASEVAGSGNRGWYVEDPRGNLNQHVDDGGVVKGVFAYDPFGKEKPALTATTAGWDSRLRFQMAPRDPKTGMYSLGPRLLDPAINRFVGADHYVASAANMELALDPLTGNRYLYAGANPANLIDDGHRPCNSKKGNWFKRRTCNLSNVGRGAAGAAKTVGKAAWQHRGLIAAAVVTGACAYATAGTGAALCGKAALGLFAANSVDSAITNRMLSPKRRTGAFVTDMAWNTATLGFSGIGKHVCQWPMRCAR